MMSTEPRTSGSGQIAMEVIMLGVPYGKINERGTRQTCPECGEEFRYSPAKTVQAARWADKYAAHHRDEHGYGQ